jgi:alpha 1,3-mannosyltransferase
MIADTECGSEERWACALSWSAKPFALLFPSFREAILIDADAFFLQNPQVLFDNAAYVQTGVLFFHGRLTRPWSKRLLQQILP